MMPESNVGYDYQGQLFAFDQVMKMLELKVINVTIANEIIFGNNKEIEPKEFRVKYGYSVGNPHPIRDNGIFGCPLCNRMLMYDTKGEIPDDSTISVVYDRAR
jgi:hypothetical protein